MATIYDVARVAGVSITTVSHVLNSTRYVSDETTERVKKAIESLNYRPNSLARALVRQETKTIALIVPDNVNPFFAELARGIENYGFEAGYNVILCNSDLSIDKEWAYLDMLISKRIDGVVYMPTGSETEGERLQVLHDHAIPVVTFDREYDDLDAILLDNFQGGYAATAHLTALGHTRIACIAGPVTNDRSSERSAGYQQALRDAGIAREEGLVETGDWSYQSGWGAAHTLWQHPFPPTAIFACNDTMAIGAMAYLQERGLDIPGDVSVVGFDNITLSAYASPPLTTLATPIKEVGERMCQMLLNRIDGRAPSRPQRFTVRGDLLVRKSTGPASN